MCRSNNPEPLSQFMTYYRIWFIIGVAQRLHLSSPSVCNRVCVTQHIYFLCKVSWTIVSLFVSLVWPLYCFPSLILITPFGMSKLYFQNTCFHSYEYCFEFFLTCFLPFHVSNVYPFWLRFFLNIASHWYPTSNYIFLHSFIMCFITNLNKLS